MIDTEELRATLESELPKADWLAFTSKRGVAAFAKLRRAPLPDGLKVAVVGPTTAEAAETLLGRVDLISEGATAASLADELKAVGPSRLLIAVAENAGETLENALTPAGSVCRRLDVYRTIPKAAHTSKQTVSSLGADRIFLASPSAVTGLINQVQLDTAPDVFTIGPSTTAAARAAGLEVAGEATRPNLQGLLEALRCAT